MVYSCFYYFVFVFVFCFVEFIIQVRNDISNRQIKQLYKCDIVHIIQVCNDINLTKIDIRVLFSIYIHLCKFDFAADLVL